MGAITVVGLGIIKISLVNILNKSANIWNAPLRPIKVGPIRRCANANNLRSVKTTNKVKSITKRDDNKAASCKFLNIPKSKLVNKKKIIKVITYSRVLKLLTKLLLHSKLLKLIYYA